MVESIPKISTALRAIVRLHSLTKPHFVPQESTEPHFFALHTQCKRHAQQLMPMIAHVASKISTFRVLPVVVGPTPRMPGVRPFDKVIGCLNDKRSSTDGLQEESAKQQKTIVVCIHVDDAASMTELRKAKETIMSWKKCSQCTVIPVFLGSQSVRALGFSGRVEMLYM